MKLIIHNAYKALATVTIETIEELNDKIGNGKPLSEAVLEFGQFLTLLATVGGKELDESEGENHDEESDEDHQR